MQIDSFIKQKLENLKESLLAPPIKLRKTLKIHVQTIGTKDDWLLKIQGRLFGSEIKDSVRFLAFFSNVKVIFEKQDQRYYKNVEWDCQNTESCFDAIHIK